MGSATEVYTYTQIGSSAVGMLMRDHIAIEAMRVIPEMGCGADLDMHDFASACYQLADAMMEARKA